ncbi:MAG: tetratricopeptide repeat protein [Labilithrix sp.]|nr:tetratricopeptide repeat protein [Labilithrix sp.]MCW5812609.1 tetratricopeptide repeat protein [Labilithrix sp.]
MARESVQLLGEAHELAPDDARITGTLALSLARVYGLEFFGPETAARAQALAQRALGVDPHQPEAQVARALLALQTNQPEAAVGHLRTALGVAPNSVDALDWLARIMSEVGRVEESLALFERVLAIDPEVVVARHHQARVHAMLGERAKMRELSERCRRSSATRCRGSSSRRATRCGTPIVRARSGCRRSWTKRSSHPRRGRWSRRCSTSHSAE